ncbi:MAG: MarR family transcriptional regulator [Alphaproteobacteria bacterium]|nr:MarR family transcriptional regulator [Alphaproteobacteria bacterium]
MDHVDRILAQWQQQRPDLDVGPMGIIGRIKRLHDRLFEEHDRIFKMYGLIGPSFDVLATLRRAGPPYALTPTELINWTMVTSGTMTNRLDRLEESGFIERRRNPEDGRGFLIALTSAGFDLVDAVVTAHVDNQHRLIAALSPKERQTLNALIKVWLSSLDEPRGD